MIIISGPSSSLHYEYERVTQQYLLFHLKGGDGDTESSCLGLMSKTMLTAVCLLAASLLIRTNNTTLKGTPTTETVDLCALELCCPG